MGEDDNDHLPKNDYDDQEGSDLGLQQDEMEEVDDQENDEEL